MEKIDRKTNIFDFFLILAIGCLSFTWFRGNYIINVGDFCFPLDRASFFYKTLFLWDHSVSMGYPAPGQLSFLVPYSLYGAFTQFLGLSLEFFQRSLFYIWFTLPGLSMYYLSSVLGFSRIARLSAALFYMMNPYNMQIPWHLASGLLLPGYAVTPLLLGLYHNALFSMQKVKYILFLSISWFMLGTYAYANPAVLIVHYFIIFTYFIFYLLINYRNFASVKKLSLITLNILLLWFLLNFLWVTPYIETLFHQAIKTSVASFGYISDFETFKLNSASFLEALRLGGLWSLHGKWEEAPYYIYADAYYNSFFVLVSFLIPILAFLPILKPRNENRESTFYFTFLGLLGVFLVKGTNPPFGNINVWLYDHVPLLGTMFRANIQKWGLLSAFAFSVLIGLGLDFIFRLMKKYVSKVLSVLAILLLLFLLVVIYVFPFWNGQLIFEGGGIIPSARTRVPDYYESFKDWTLSNKEEWRIFSLPLSKNSNTVYDWDKNGYAGADIIRWFSDKPVIYANYGTYYDIPPMIASQIEEGSDKNVEKLFSFLGCKYILVHNDINWKSIERHSWWINHDMAKIRKFIESSKGLQFEKSFGKLDLYRNTGYYNPAVYINTKPYFVDGGVESLLSIINSQYFKSDKPLYLFSSDEQNAELSEKEISRLYIAGDKLQFSSMGNKAPELKTSNPELSFRMISPVKYIVRIKNTESPFWLVFSETYHSQWKVFDSSVKHYLSSGSGFNFFDMAFLFRKPINIPHYVGNGYCNTWYIDPNRFGLGKDFIVEIYFLPQSFFYAGLLVSVSVFVICLSYLVIILIGERHEK